MASRRGDSGSEEERARRKADSEMVFAYHREQLRNLQDHLREGFARFDRGEIDSFDLDHLIFHYSRSAKELWKFCGNGESRIGWQLARSNHAVNREVSPIGGRSGTLIGEGEKSRSVASLCGEKCRYLLVWEHTAGAERSAGSACQIERQPEQIIAGLCPTVGVGKV